MPVQEKVAISLYRLGSGDGLQNNGDLYKVDKTHCQKQ